MNVVSICSTIRQHERYVRSFIAQIEALAQEAWQLGSVNLVCDGRNGIVDPVLVAFAHRCPNVHLILEEASDVPAGSMAQKAVQWARIGNQALDAALATPCTHVLYIEADLCFPFDLVEQLIARRVDIVAPVVFLGANFYDSWGFRTLQGQRVSRLGEVNIRGGAIELGSVGSCALIRREVVERGVRFPPRYDDGLFVGLCSAARELGYRVWADPATSIVHPTSSWRRQIWVVEHMRVVLADGRQLEFAVDLALARLSDVFIREAIEIAYERLFHQVPPGTYVLNIFQDAGARTQRWSFDAEAEGAGGSEVRIASRATVRTETGTTHSIEF